MSRSWRKNPYIGIAGDSDKKDKQLANRRLRRRVKEELNKGREVLVSKRESSNVWSFSKDGKTRVEKDSRWMRK